jgi:uncharacterized membrane protein
MPPTLPHASRWPRVDALRGVAMLWMAIFHFDFDLNHFGFIEPKQRFFSDPFWVTQRTGILSLFLFAAGLSLALGFARQRSALQFWRRWGQVAAGAALVSLATWFTFADRWIWFGVLHGMAVMLVLCWSVLHLRALRERPWVWMLLGLLLVLAPQGLKSTVMDASPWQWLGLGTRKPLTQDWVPLLPWVGVMCAGVAVGLWAHRSQMSWWSRPAPAFMQPMVTLGQWSLSFYLVHQALFFALMAAFVWLRR